MQFYTMSIRLSEAANIIDYTHVIGKLAYSIQGFKDFGIYEKKISTSTSYLALAIHLARVQMLRSSPRSLI